MPGVLASTAPVILIAEIRFPPQLSDAVAPGSTNAAWHSLLMELGPVSLKIGFSVSRTITRNTHCAVLPDASVAVQVTRFVPAGNALPEGGWHSTVVPGLLSFAVTTKVTTAEHSPSVLVVVILAPGQVIVGG